MRIALTITALHPGGAEKCFANLALFLKRRGHEVETWQLWPEPPEGKRALVEQLQDAGVGCHSLGIDRAWNFPRGVGRLGKQLKEYAPDVIQSFLFHANVAIGLAGNRIAPLVGGIRVSQPQHWRGRLQRWISHRMEKLVCVSQSVHDYTANTEGVPAEKLLVIPNGIDLATLPTAKTDWTLHGLPANAPVILFVGRLDEQKGILPFLEYVDSLLNQLPEHHLVLMGRGAQEAEITDRIRSCPRIHWAGYQPDAMAWMQSADVVVLPARYEGMPNVIMEAMAGSTAVATFEVDGIRELLGESETSDAQIATTQNFEKLNQNIIDLCSDAELRSRCARYNRERIETHFQLDHQLEKYLDLYQSLARAN